MTSQIPIPISMPSMNNSGPMPTPVPTPTPPPNKNLNPYDSYGCNVSAGYYFSPSQSACCKCEDQGPPSPWVCTSSQLSKTESITDRGCRTDQTYNMNNNHCYDCMCVAPYNNPNQS